MISFSNTYTSYYTYFLQKLNQTSTTTLCFATILLIFHHCIVFDHLRCQWLLQLSLLLHCVNYRHRLLSFYKINFFIFVHLHELPDHEVDFIAHACGTVRGHLAECNMLGQSELLPFTN